MLLAALFRLGFADIPPFFPDDTPRPDGRGRSTVGAGIAPGGYRDEIAASVPVPTLWRGVVQMIPGAGHAPQWETPEAFGALVTAFVKETA